MCGIAGSINVKLDIPLVTKIMHHRGPDEQTTFEEGNLVLHHHRLAILDIGGGRQPMHYGPYTIIFNGEIYNHLEVRAAHGLQCKTHSDTETILHAYQKLGSKCLNDFDGMFAFVIYDRTRNELFIARDRAGKKPFYYYSEGDKFVFASELNVLNSQLPLEINENHIQQYVRLGYFYKASTAYNNVFELPAGSHATVSLAQPRVQPVKWWNIHDHYQRPSGDDFQTASSRVDAMLHKAVRNRVESSDLEVGSFLSGGIDSGLVTAVASEYNSSLKTFTVSFEGEYDEAPLAKLVAEKYKTDHQEIRISFDRLANDIEKIISNYGEPFFDSSAIPSYYVSQAARKHLTVILNGDGGDEVFAGYRRYVPFAKHDFFNSGGITKAMAKLLFSVMPVSHNKKNKYNYVYRLVDLMRKNKLEAYLSSTIDSFEGFTKYLINDPGYLDPVLADFNAMNRSGLTGLQKIMNLDFDNILAGVLLVKMDIATMANSLEGRSPLLSKDILEYVPGLPDNYKIRGVQTKYLLRKLAEKYLPAELINQPKRGFEPPQKKWVNNELKPLIHDYLTSAAPLYESYIQKDFVQRLLDDKVRVPAEKRSKMLWCLFAMEVWYRKVHQNKQRI